MGRWLCWSFCAGLMLAPAALGQSGPRVITMTLTPAKAPIPALKHHLFPELRHLKQGNAAVFYQRSQALDWWGQAMRQNIVKISADLERPYQKDFTDKYSWITSAGPLKELDYAARCEHCDWQTLDRIRTDGIMFLVPDVQGLRTLATLNAGRARIAIHRGDFDEAIDSLQSSFALGKHLGEAPLMINALVGYAIANVALNGVEEFVQQPRAPNLYWALTDLPRPLIDLRRPLQSERVVVDGLFPEIRQALKDPDAPPLPAKALGKRIERQLALLGIRHDPASLLFSVARTYPSAKEYLQRQGRTAEQVDALPVLQVVLMHQYAVYDIWADEIEKLNNLPYWELRKGLQSVRQTFKLEEKVQAGGILPLLLLQSPERVYAVRVRLERRIALLRCVEALRLYAAEHGQRWPASLDEIHAVPVPVDPLTGKAFAYRVEKGRAILEANPPSGEESTHHSAVRIEMQLANGTKK